MIRTTVGQLLVNEALPEDLRDYNRTLSKKGVTDLMRDVAQRYPDRYVDVSKRLADIGREAATESGGTSAGPEHFSKAKASIKFEAEVRQQLRNILNNEKLTPQQRSEAVIKAVGSRQPQLLKEILDESIAEKNPFALQVLSGSRGNQVNLASLRGSDLLYEDHHGNIIPVPVLRSYSQGLSPMEYWSGTYGARRGVLATKFAVRDAGYLSKQLNQVSHRLVVTDDDYDDEEQRNLPRGLPVDTADMDNEGALLARDTGGYPRNTPLTPKIMKDLERRGIKRLLVRSPMVGGSPEGGVYARDVGIREKGVLPGRGEQVGLQTAQALSEPLSQAQLSAKHSGGVAGQEKSLGGFAAINQLIQVPKVFKGGAAHANLDGHVQRIEPAPAGGTFVTIDNEKHYVHPGFDLKVKKGDFVEAGDVLSEGLPDPSVVTHFKGNGEGRRYFVQAAHQAMRDAGLKPHRRNLELLARGLINHVRLTAETDDNVPGDIVPYSTLEHTYKPREGFRTTAPTGAVGKYLERPYLHYTIGTKIRPSMLNNFAEFGIDKVDVHDDPPPFEPEMIRGMYSLHHDPDWITRFYGSGQKSSLLDAVHRGATSEETGTSFVPGLIRSVDFGRQGIVKQPEPGKPPTMDDDDMPRTQAISPKLNLSPLKPKLAPVSTDWVKAASDQAARLEAEARARVQRIKQASSYDPTGSSGPGGSSAQGGAKSVGTVVDGSRAEPTKAPTAAKPQQLATPATPPPPPQPGTQTTQPAWLNGPQITAQSTPGGGTSYDRYAQQRAGRYGGYQQGRSLFHDYDAKTISQFVAGNEQGQMQPGDDMAAAARFLTAIDPHALATLTAGSGYVNDNYDGAQSQQGGYGYGGGQEMQFGGETQQTPATDGANPEVAQEAMNEPSLIDELTEIGRRMPATSSPASGIISAAASPGQVALGYGLRGAGNAIARVAPRAGRVVGAAGQFLTPTIQVARTGSTFSRLMGTAGSKTMPALSGLMNVAWAPLEAATRAATGDTEGAKRLFWDKDYHRSLGDSSRSYVSRTWDAMDPRNFYNNAALTVSNLHPENMAHINSGVYQSAAGLIGMDDTSRHNRFVASDEGKAKMLAESRAKGDQIYQHNLASALTDGRAVLENGRPMPSPAWREQYMRNFPNSTPEDVERGFLEATFSFSPNKIDENGYVSGYMTPDEIWESFHSRPR